MHVSPPVNGTQNPITVNGRTYNVPVGQAVTVPDQDGFVMRANGWTQVPYIAVVSITQAAYNALTVQDPNTFYVING